MGDADRETLVAALPLAAAIGLFGVIYGAAAGPLFGPGLTLASSAVVFSGTVQFTVAGLAAGGESPLALLAAAALVNTRNLALGAMIRPHLRVGRLGRAARAWFLIDEVVGLALANRERAGWTLCAAGSLAYVAWFAGTAIGLAGGGVLPGMTAIAGALFPVLFVGLAAMASTSLSLALRAVAAGALTVGLAILWPDGRAIVAVLAAVLVALPTPRAGPSPGAGEPPR